VQLGAKLQAFTGSEVQKESILKSIYTDLNTLKAEIGDIDSAAKDHVPSRATHAPKY
jgi:hypothetical protein